MDTDFYTFPIKSLSGAYLGFRVPRKTSEWQYSRSRTLRKILYQELELEFARSEVAETIAG